MMKNGTKILLAAIMACVCLYAAFFIIRTCGQSIPGLTDGFYIPKDSIKEPVMLDLNAATAEELDDIPGVGTGLSQAIVVYREKYGDYVDIDELLNIRGMSEELYAQIIQYISLGGA